MCKVVFVENSMIDEWDYGGFNGTIKSVVAKPAEWCSLRGEMKEAVKAHRAVVVGGVDGAWREYRFALKRGRTRVSVIKEACELAGKPENITKDKHGFFGSFVDVE